MIIDCSLLSPAYIDGLLGDYPQEWQQAIIHCVHDYLSQGSDEFSFTTSGSTGSPQTVLRTRAMIQESSHRTVQCFELELCRHALLCLPVRYVAGRMMIYRAIEHKWILYCLEPKTKLPIDESWKIDFAACIPLQVRHLAAYGAMKQIEKMIIGGSRISTGLRDTLSSTTTQCFETYGMTETLTHVAYRSAVTDEVFEALDGVTFSSTSQDALVVHDPICGDYVTTDIVDLHSCTSFSLLGRADRVINMGGLKIHPETLERVIEPLVEGNYFIARQEDPEYTAIPVLYVESADDALRVQQHLSERTLRPRKYYITTMKFTPTEKLITRPDAYPDAQIIHIH